MTVTKQRISSIIKEELTRARRMNEMMDGPYNDDLQSRHGRFTSPENVMGTPQHRAAHGPYVSDRRGAPSTPMGPASEEELERIRAKHGDSLTNRPYIEYDGPNSPNSSYYGLREADDDMDTAGDDMDIDVVADDADGEDDMGDDMGGDDMMSSEMEAEIDWSQFKDQDGDAVGAAFMDAIKQLSEEMPEETPTAAAVVERMQEILMGDDEADDNAFSDDPAPLAEGVDWRRRAGLLAGITKRY
jgi:hypothetical protein